MTPDTPSLEERARELRFAARVAEKLGDLVFARNLRERAAELEEEFERAQYRDNASALRRTTR